MAQTFLGIKKDRKFLLLDIGCGNGYRSSAFNVSSNIRIIGIDINIDQINSAKKSNSTGSQFILGDIAKLPFKDSTFDALFSSSVLQYVEWRSVVKNSSKVLKPGGNSVYIENLEGSPLAIVYRALHTFFGWKYNPCQTPKKHIKLSELHYFKNIFSEVVFFPIHLLTSIVLIIPALKKGIFKTPISLQSPKLYRILLKIDNWLLKQFPYLAAYCWRVVICCKKYAA